MRKYYKGERIKFQVPYLNSYFVGYGTVVEDKGNFVNVEVKPCVMMEAGGTTDITKLYIVDEIIPQT